MKSRHYGYVNAAPFSLVSLLAFQHLWTHPAFLPQGYKPPDEGPAEYQTIPLNKIEDFGVHCKQYYSLEVSYFKSSLDRRLLDSLWNKYWVNTLSSSSLLTVSSLASVLACVYVFCIGAIALLALATEYIIKWAQCSPPLVKGNKPVCSFHFAIAPLPSACTGAAQKDASATKHKSSAAKSGTSVITRRQIHVCSTLNTHMFPEGGGLEFSEKHFLLLTLDTSNFQQIFNLVR